MAINQRTITGNLTADPILRFTPNGYAVVNFRIAHSPRRKNQSTGEWEDGETEFIDCTDWRQRAENVAESLGKGNAVLIVGRSQTRHYETKEGEKRTVHEIVVDEIGPSLDRATTVVTRNPKKDYSNQNQAQGQGSRQQGSGDGYSDEAPF